MYSVMKLVRRKDSGFLTSSGRISSRSQISMMSIVLPLLVLTLRGCAAIPVKNSHDEYGARLDDDDERRFQPIKVYGGASERQQVDSTTYLMRYGYLPSTDVETGALRTELELMRAVLEFQRNANIPETGRLDEMTFRAMRRSRCGVVDVLPSHGHLNGHTDKHAKGHARKLHSGSSVRGSRHVRHGGSGRRVDEGIEPSISAGRGTRSIAPQEYNLGPSIWQKKWLTFRILNYTPDMDRDETRDAIIRAFYLWSDVTMLTFHEVETGHADIYIQFASGYHNDGYAFDGQGMVLAHAFFPGEDRGGDIHLDEDENWTNGPLHGVNLYAVVAHELGHSLGLAHSYVPGSLMYPWHKGHDPNLSLHQDDITAIQYLYGVKHKNSSDPGLTPPPTPRRTPPTTTSTTMTSRITSTQRHVTKSADDSEPDRCTASFDAISLVRGDVFAFSGKWFWRMSDDGVLPGYPVLVSRFWFGLPKDLTNIDAIFERPGNGHIVFFIGKRYFEFYGNTLLSPYSPYGRPITDFGLPEDLSGIDAAFVWAHNNRVYLMKDQMYWKLDDSGKSVEYGYPRDMSMWSGVPVPVNSAFTHTNQLTYFFHEGDYYEFNNVRMKINHKYPQPMAPRWLGCKSNKTATKTSHDYKQSANSSFNKLKTLEVELVTLFCLILVMLNSHSFHRVILYENALL